MEFTSLLNEIKTEAENDAQTFVAENDCAFDPNSGSGEYEAVSVREYLHRRGIDYSDLADEQYSALLETYAETIAAESARLLQ